MEDKDWIKCAVQLPPNDAPVETKIDDDKGERNIQKLVRRGRLWWTNDTSEAMYVYYTPTHWRAID